MEFKVIKRNGNAVIPDGMFKLCGMEDAKLISMVQLNGGILLMPESVSTYQLLMLVDALNKLACDFLEAVAIECGPAEEEHRDMTLDEVLSEFAVAVPDWARESAGIAKNAKLECYTDDGSGAVLVQKASHRHDLTDIPPFDPAMFSGIRAQPVRAERYSDCGERGWRCRVKFRSILTTPKLRRSAARLKSGARASAKIVRARAESISSFGKISTGCI